MRFINDIGIVTKLSVAFGTLTAVTIGISAIGYIRLSSIEHTNGLTEHTYKVLTGLESVTQYELYKAIWSSLNDANFFELAWALKRHQEFTERFAPTRRLSTFALCQSC